MVQASRTSQGKPCDDDPTENGKEKGMTRIIAILGMLAILTGCTAGSPNSTSAPGELAVSTSAPGSPAVYERIRGLTGCGELQREFDIAMRNVERLEPGSRGRDVLLSYAGTADSRMRDIGCYDQ